MIHSVDDLQLIQERLARVSQSDLPAEARRMKVPLGTVTKIKYRTTTNPRWRTVKKMAAYYRANP